MRHIPQRSCIACRRVRGKSELLRIVRTPLGAVEVDPTGKMAGRGAYVCRDENCVAQAIKQKKLGRALGVAVEQSVMDEVRSCLGDRNPSGESERQGEQ
jgi:predicted RNA-binding protein YlxR (DUF448 family)